MSLLDKIDSLIGAIHMLVGQMQAEKLAELRWQQWRDYCDTYHFREGEPLTEDPKQLQLRETARDADRRAAGIGSCRE